MSHEHASASKLARSTAQAPTLEMHREDCHDLARQCGCQSPEYQNLSRGTKTRPARLVPARPALGTGPGR
jgi:hypothetical protein